MSGSVIFLDLATQMGWCEGVPGEKPTSGTVRLASPGSPPSAVFGGLVAFLAARLTTFKYRMVVYEAPMDPRHMKTNINTARMLIGMPAIVEGLCDQTGHYRIAEASVNDVRKHLLNMRPAKDQAKAAVISKLRTMGFDPSDDNEADAIAGWLYAGAILAPGTATAPTPLFRAKR